MINTFSESDGNPKLMLYIVMQICSSSQQEQVRFHLKLHQVEQICESVRLLLSLLNDTVCISLSLKLICAVSEATTKYLAVVTC